MTEAKAKSSALSATIVAQYETLRSAMLGEALPPDARSGLIVFLRHGMWEWARTLTPGVLGRSRFTSLHPPRRIQRSLANVAPSFTCSPLWQ
jgi:hypothetical protein